MQSNSRTILIIGATSAIAEATARLWADEMTALYLIARNASKLALVAKDLQLRGAAVFSAIHDLNEFSGISGAVEAAFAALGGRVDTVLIAHGDLPDQGQCESTEAITLNAVNTNAVSTVLLLTNIANRMRNQRSGVIAVIGSVAGDRGRKSNYVYGACKAMVATYMEGLAGRMHPFGVAVITIKPGFVDTPMTAQFKKGALWAKPEQVAEIISRRVGSRRSGGFYAPRFWGLIMLIIKHLPAQILYRLNI